MGRFSWYSDARVPVFAVVFLTAILACHRETHLQRLARSGTRNAEGRLTGFSWSPFVAKRSLNANQRAAVASVSEAISEEHSHYGRHAEAVANFVAGNDARALQLLLAIPEESRTAAIWTDLATVQMNRAASGSAPAIVDAIAAADSALILNPQSAEAHFNRALAIEKLGLRDAAAEAWRRYLEIDPGSAWADEARTHLQPLATPLPTFEPALAERREKIARGDRQAAQYLLEHFPHETRSYAETEALGGWGESGDPMLLSVAREIGRELAIRGDAGLKMTVERIVRAGAEDRMRLARAHASLTAGRRALRAAPTRAEPLFRDAATLFEQAKSPMVWEARYFAATAAFTQNRPAQARDELRALLASTPEPMRSLRASILWQLALTEAAFSDWGATLRALEEGAVLFDRIGESYDAAVLRQLMSELYDLIGDQHAAWKIRGQVLRVIGRTTNLRTQNAISSISNDAAIQKHWRVAISLLNLEIDMAARADDRPSHADALLRRAFANHQLHRDAKTASDLAAAKMVGAEMTDPGLRERNVADTMALEALVTTDARQAIPKLDAAIDFHRRRGRLMFLPNFYLARGLAHRAVGNEALARADIDAGIRSLEDGRDTIADTLSRFGCLDAGEDLFLEAISDALTRGDVTAAFAYAERSRARALLDSLKVPATTAPPRDTAIVEFVSLRDRVVVFVRTAHDLLPIDLHLQPQVVATQAVEMRNAFADNSKSVADVRSRCLYEQLIEPILPSVGNLRTFIFVTDASTAAIPFAALRGPDGRYLMERYTIGFAPSAAIYLRTVPPPVGRPSRALVVANSNSLRAVKEEAHVVASLYPHPTVLGDADATFDAFKREAPAAQIIHFAGHADSADDGAAATSLSMPGLYDVRQLERVSLAPNAVVVLAACNTARGEMRWSEGPLSAARACLAGGARSVVATLWKVDDNESARFFPMLHAHLAAGLAPIDALRQTQLEWIRRSPDRVSMWAAVQAIGR